MPVHDNLGKRMKEYYEIIPKTKLMRRCPVAIRIDGKAFHTFTRGFDKPFDEILMQSMQETALFMCKNIQNTKFAYIQSDEITLILTDYDTFETQAFFDYEIQKICSIVASMATMSFNKIFAHKVIEETANGEYLEGSAKAHWDSMLKGAMFDARCFNIPKEEVCNLIYWRQLDATRNSIQMVGQANFSHRELQNKSCSMIQDMLHEQKGINWNDFPTDCKRGAACRKVKSTVNIAGTMDEVETWQIDKEMPILKGEDREYVDALIRSEECSKCLTK